jgi:DNA-binding transcriptional regulator GbsR (MarR family)
MNAEGRRFVELMGRHLEEEGVPRIAGRLMGALLLNQGPTSLDELTEQLAVSKGSVSSNARLLELWGIADRITMAGDRRDYYQIAPNVEERVLRRQIERLRVMMERLEVGRNAVRSEDGPAEQRFDALIDFLGRALVQTEENLGSARRP